MRGSQQRQQNPIMLSTSHGGETAKLNDILLTKKERTAINANLFLDLQSCCCPLLTIVDHNLYLSYPAILWTEFDDFTHLGGVIEVEESQYEVRNQISLVDTQN